MTPYSANKAVRRAVRTAPARAGSGGADVFRDFLSLAVLHKDYAQHFSPPDLYAMGLAEDLVPLRSAGIRSLWEEYARSPGRGAVNLYLTVPYCLKRCRYCIFFKKLLSSPRELEDYKDRLAGLARFFGPVFRRLEFANLFFGGGTPSIFTARQLREIFAGPVAGLRVRPGGEKTFECEPLTASRAKLEAARAAGFDRVSLGVQALDRAVLKLLGREYQKDAMVSSFLRSARDLGFSDINADLLMGLRGETPEKFAAGFARLLRMKPDTVSIYQFIPPQEYLDLYSGGDQDAFQRSSLSFRRRVYPLLAAAAGRLGFDAPGAEAFLMRDRMAGSVVFKRRGAEIKEHYAMGELGPADAYFTLGWQGDSYIPAKAFYQTTPLAADPAKNVFMTVPLSGRKAMVFHVLRRVASYNEVDRMEFRALFGRDPVAVFRAELAELARAGLARAGKEKIVFAKTDMKTRFLASMKFIGARRLSARVNEWLSERRLLLRFGRLSYSARLEYSAAGLSLRLSPGRGASRSPAFEALARKIFERSSGAPGGLGGRVEAFEKMMRYAVKGRSGEA
ncbi:MAG: radical SAM protein [Elusimicrobiales bacterium]|nr:radical SAM protein [Elusimicrobiales bacterium]